MIPLTFNIVQSSLTKEAKESSTLIFALISTEVFCSLKVFLRGLGNTYVNEFLFKTNDICYDLKT